jgi:uncharacterized coiled-coil protein SlyX
MATTKNTKPKFQISKENQTIVVTSSGQAFSINQLNNMLTGQKSNITRAEAQIEIIQEMLDAYNGK